MEVKNIKIRFIAETNEVLLHPFYFTILIKECTKPREGGSKDSLVEKVKSKIYPIATKKGVGFSKRSAEILLDLAVHMEFLHKDYHWNSKGMVINATAKFLDRLDLPDRIAYLKYHLEADGGALLHLVKKIRENGILERSFFLKNRGWEGVLKNMADEYLRTVLDPKQRFKLREILKSAEKGFTKHTQEHRLNPRTETLVDLEILQRESNRRISYYPNKIDGSDAVTKFTELFTDLNTLENILSPHGDFFSRTAKLFNLTTKKIDIKNDFALISTHVAKAYETIRDDSFRLANIDAIKDIVCINSLAFENKICEWMDVDTTIQKMRHESQADLHYHVDDWGKISYITMKPSYVRHVINAE